MAYVTVSPPVLLGARAHLIRPGVHLYYSPLIDPYLFLLMIVLARQSSEQRAISLARTSRC
jgi:hypothetical protein